MAKLAECEVRMEDGFLVIHVQSPLQCRQLQEVDTYALPQGVQGKGGVDCAHRREHALIHQHEEACADCAHRML